MSIREKIIATSGSPETSMFGSKEKKNKKAEALSAAVKAAFEKSGFTSSGGSWQHPKGFRGKFSDGKITIGFDGTSKTFWFKVKSDNPSSIASGIKKGCRTLVKIAKQKAKASVKSLHEFFELSASEGFVDTANAFTKNSHLTDSAFDFTTSFGNKLIEKLGWAEEGSFEDHNNDPKQRPLIAVLKRSKGKGKLKIKTIGEVADLLYALASGMFGDSSWDSYTPAQSKAAVRIRKELKAKLNKEQIEAVNKLRPGCWKQWGE